MPLPKDDLISDLQESAELAEGAPICGAYDTIVGTGTGALCKSFMSNCSGPPRLCSQMWPAHFAQIEDDSTQIEEDSLCELRELCMPPTKSPHACCTATESPFSH